MYVCHLSKVSVVVVIQIESSYRPNVQYWSLIMLPMCHMSVSKGGGGSVPPSDLPLLPVKAYIWTYLKASSITLAAAFLYLQTAISICSWKCIYYKSGLV